MRVIEERKDALGSVFIPHQTLALLRGAAVAELDGLYDFQFPGLQRHQSKREPSCARSSADAGERHNDVEPEPEGFKPGSLCSFPCAAAGRMRIPGAVFWACKGYGLLVATPYGIAFGAC